MYKVAKTKRKKKWQHSKVDYQTNTYALFDDSHRWTFDPGGQALTKQEDAIRDQVCRSEDRSSQEGGDDGHHPATFIPLVEEKALDLRTNPFQEGGDDGRGPSTTLQERQEPRHEHPKPNQERLRLREECLGQRGGASRPMKGASRTNERSV